MERNAIILKNRTMKVRFKGEDLQGVYLTLEYFKGSFLSENSPARFFVRKANPVFFLPALMSNLLKKQLIPLPFSVSSFTLISFYFPSFFNLAVLAFFMIQSTTYFLWNKKKKKIFKSILNAYWKEKKILYNVQGKEMNEQELNSYFESSNPFNPILIKVPK